MQHNKNQDNSAQNATPIRCADIAQQPVSPTYNARTMSNQNFPPHYVNPRFCVTPDTMGMNSGSGNQATFRECQQLTQQEAPLVDVKSYYERHNIKQLGGKISDLKLERNTSYHSTQTNEPQSSFVSIKSEHNTRQLSPRSANNYAQQWNFDNTCRQQKQTEQPQQLTGISSTSLHCSTQSLRPLTSSVKFSFVNALGGPSAATVRKPSQDGCISILTNKLPVCSRQHSNPPAELSTSYFEQQLKKYHTGSDVFTENSAKINYGTLNKMFLKRLQDIDANAWGDRDLKLITFQEWVDMLLKINDSFITNMEELEKEVAERLELVQQKVNTKCNYSQGNELMKYRRDIENLLKILNNAYCNNNWDMSGITFETISPAQILPPADNFYMEGSGVIEAGNDSEVMQRNKLLANIKALAHEVAEKHDEVRELKRQIICLEDDIQKAHQKIQIKDDYIKELRNDLKCSNHKFETSNHPQEANLAMPPINFENQTERSNNSQITDCNTLTDENNSQFDSLSHAELEEQHKIKVLEKELNEFFELARNVNKQKMENQRTRLMDIFQAAESEKAKAYCKLDFIRRQLIDLDSNNTECVNDGDSGFHSKGENDQDVKILDAVRKRLRKFHETNCELKKKIQKLEIENSKLSTNLQSEKNFAQRNNETLKQIADLLGGMTSKQFCYTDIYNKAANEQNPFCEAIRGIKQACEEREQQLLKVVALKNKEIEELLINEKKFNEARGSQVNLNNTKDVFETTTTTTTTSPNTPALEISTVTILTTNTSTMSSSLTGQQRDNMTSTFHKDS